MAESAGDGKGSAEADLALEKITHKTLANVDKMIPGLRYNAAVAQIYTLVNALEQSARQSDTSSDILKTSLTITLQMIAPMMPHLAEECWKALGNDGLISAADWPKTNESLLVESDITMPVQINGKKRGEITVPKDMDKESIEKHVLDQDFVQSTLSGKEPKKVIVVPGRIVNVVA